MFINYMGLNTVMNFFYFRIEFNSGGILVCKYIHEWLKINIHAYKIRIKNSHF